VPYPATTARTVTWHDIDEWRRDNKFILAGYRPPGDFWQAFESLTFLHNETCNVCTHLIGAVVLPLFASDVLRAMSASQYTKRTDFVMFGVFFISAEICLVFSASYHLLESHSYKVERLWHQMDLLGIVIATVGTFVPGIYYIFNCEPLLQKMHWTMVCNPGHLAHLRSPEVTKVVEAC
jgi:adiponectin receptor